MLGCYSSTAVRQQNRHDRRNMFSIFGLFGHLDRPSPQIAGVLPLSMSTPKRSMILDSPAQHHEETCRRARQVFSRYGTAPEASVDEANTKIRLIYYYDHRRRLGGTRGAARTRALPIIENRPCSYHFLPPFPPIFWFAHPIFLPSQRQ